MNDKLKIKLNDELSALKNDISTTEEAVSKSMDIILAEKSSSEKKNLIERLNYLQQDAEIVENALDTIDDRLSIKNEKGRDTDGK